MNQTGMLFVFVYVDLFSLYRPGFRKDLEAGKIGGFTVNQSFLLGTTVYVVIPSLMVFCTLILHTARGHRLLRLDLAEGNPTNPRVDPGSDDHGI